MDNTYEKFLAEFPPQSRADWERKIAGDCQGVDIEKELFWNTHENIRVKPFYCQEDTSSLEYLNDFSSRFLLTGREISWKIRQDIKVQDYKEAGLRADFLTRNGVDAPGFDIRGLKPDVQDYTSMLQGVDTSVYPVHWVADGLSLNEHLSKLLGTGIKALSGSSCVDPLGDLFTSGTLNTGLIRLNESLNLASELPGMRIISARGYLFQNAGASNVQELAFTLSMAAEYLSSLTGYGIPAYLVLKHMQVTFGISGNYFFEIAKLRAARVLWAAMISAYGVDPVDYPLHIESISSSWNKTIYESHVNILRSSTEAMSAIIGGCDTIKIKGHDECYRTPGDHSLRIARNIPVILREECSFGKVTDPSAGSWYVEHLTDEICSGAWKLFLETERHGGFIKAIETGFISSDIAGVAVKRMELAANASETILGTNLYPDPNEHMTGLIENGYPSPGLRVSSDFERLRLAVERYDGKRPGVFLLPYGNPAWSNARAQFSAGFFAAAGYEIIDNPAFKSPAEGILQALGKKADIVVFCSSDDEYESLIPEIKQYAGNRMIFVVAGTPGCKDQLKENGVNSFIYTGINIVETLEGFHRKLGINF